MAYYEADSQIKLLVAHVIGKLKDSNKPLSSFILFKPCYFIFILFGTWILYSIV